MNVLRKILALRSVQNYLQFGINENVVLQKFAAGVKMNNDGTESSKHNTLTFSTLDSKDAVLASSSFSYWNLDPLKEEMVLQNLIDEIAQLSYLLSMYMPDTEVADKFDPVSKYESVEELTEALTTDEGCRDLMETIGSTFKEAIKPYIGLKGKLLRMKVITDYKSGKYLNLPQEPNIWEGMDQKKTSLKITKREKDNAAKASKPQVAKPTAVGGAPSMAGGTKNLIDQL